MRVVGPLTPTKTNVQLNQPQKLKQTPFNWAKRIKLTTEKQNNLQSFQERVELK